MNEIVRDNGFKSRKFWFSVFITVVMLFAWLVAGVKPALAPLYDTLVGGLVALAGLYLTGSIATKWVGSKAPASPARAPDLEEPPPAPAKKP